MSGITGYTGVTNTDPFTPPADITAVYEHFDPLIGESVATLADLPSGGWAGRTVWVVESKVLRVYDGSAWVSPSYAGKAAGNISALTTTFQSACSLTVPPGQYRVSGECYLNWAVSGAYTAVVRLYNNTTAAELDSLSVTAPSSGLFPVSVSDLVTVAATTVIRLEVRTFTTGGTQFVQNGKLIITAA